MSYASPGADNNSLEAMLARDQALELATPYVPPPGNPLEHHAAGFADTLSESSYVVTRSVRRIPTHDADAGRMHILAPDGRLSSKIH